MKAPATRPLFILGSGRCGSTLLHTMLIGHSKIVLTNEARLVNVLHFCSQLAAPIVRLCGMAYVGMRNGGASPACSRPRG